MDAGGEIDLIGVQDLILKTTKRINELDTSLEKLDKDVKTATRVDIAKQMRDIGSSIDSLYEKMSNYGSSVKALETITNALETLQKAASVAGDYYAGFYPNLPVFDFKKPTEDINKMYSATQKIVKELQKPHKPIFDYEGAEKGLDVVRKKIASLQEQYELLKKQSKAAFPVDVGGKEGLNEAMKKAREDIKALKNDENEIIGKINKAKEAQEQYNQEVLKVFYALQDVVSVYSAISDEVARLKATGGDQKEIKSLERKKSTLEKSLNSYKEIFDYASKIANVQEEENKRRSDAAINKRLQNLIKERDLREKENAAWLKQHDIEAMILEGREKGVLSFIKQGQEVGRLKRLIEMLRIAQNKLNDGTAKGKKEAERVGATIDLIQKRVDKLQGTYTRFNELFGKTKKLAGQVAMSLGVMGGVFGAVNLIRNVYRITSEFELQQKALAAITQNAREANILFKQMQTLATNSPLKLMDLNRYAKQLAAYRIETNNLYDSLKMLGDISVGVGVDMDRLILAYGQVKAANYLRGQELRQFSEAGVNILGGLQEYYKETKNISMSINEIFDSVSKRKVLFEDVDAVLHRMTEAGGAFFNMQLIQSQTLYGQYQKLGDMFQINMNKVGESTSGILMAMIKIAQALISNLRVVLNIIIGIASAKGIYALYQSLYKANLVSKDLRLSLSGASKNMRQLVVWGQMLTRLQFGKLVTSLRRAASTASSLGMAIRGVVAGITTMALSAAFSWFQNTRQRAKELSDEILEMNKRYVELKKVSDDFSRATDFKSQRIELQKLVEKAKEYKYNLTLPAKITPDNISYAFKNAAEQLRYYIQQTQYYTTQFNTNVLQKRVADLNQTMSDYSVAQKSANDLYEKYLLDFSKLSEEEQRIVLELQTKREEYRLDEKAAAEKYGEDRIAFERNFVREIASIRRGYLFGNEIYESVGDWKTYNKALQNVDEFEKEYERKLDKAFKSINRRAKLANLAKNISGLEGDELEKRLIKEIPPIINSLSQLGDFAKSDIIRKISEALDKDYSTVAKAYVKYENGTSDIGDPEFKRTMEEIFGKDSVIRKEVKVKITEIEYPQGMTNPDGSFNPFLNASAREGSAFFTETAEVIKKTLDKSTEEITNEIDSKLKSGKTVDEIKKDMDGMVESARAALNQYQKVGKGGADLASVNAQNAQSFETAADGARYYTEALRKLGVVYQKNAWDLPKIKGGGRGKSFVEEYQSMIDFVKKLNEEYERLRQNFSEDVSYDKIIKNFNESFADMPQEFKDKFGELQNIIFNSKLGTAEGEKLVKEIIEASSKLKPDEIAKLRRNVQQYIDQLEAEFNVEIKIKEDERLKAQVQKMFDDYNLTIELDKLGVDADEVGKLFNIDTKDLLTLENKLESMKDEFVGRQMEKEYRQFMRKIVEINDKANLEMAKKYVKYLREEYGERAKVELEYMRQRAEVYALPFDEDETMRILDNLQKETQKKLDEIDWKSFTSSDMYIEVFEDLERVSNSAIESMLRHLEELKSSLKNLSPSDLKAITEQMQKLRDEMIKRNPFKSLADSIKEYKSATKDLKTKNLINEVLGRDADTPIKNFRKTLNKAVDAARDAQLEAQNKVNLAETLLGAGKSRDEAENWLKEHVVDWDEHYDEKGLEEVLKNIEQSRDEAAKKISNDRLQKILSGEERLGLTENEEQYLRYDQQAKNISKLLSSLKVLSENDMTFESIGNLSSDLEFAKENLKDVTDQANELADTKKRLDDWAKAVKAMGELLGDWTQKAKESFDSIYEGLESIGVGTDTIGQAWKEFGDEMFDTISRALQMLPAMVAAITTAETAINAAAGWIGLIAEAITLIMSGIKAISGLHDSYKQAEIEKLQKSLDKLEKTAEDLSEAFESSYAEEELRQLDAALIRTRELAIATLEDMKEAEEAKKKSDQAVIDDYQNQIDSLNKEMQEGIDNFYEALGGFGSAANMKSTVEEWTDAWYEAFKETGDGLSGLEDSFEEFFENIVKKKLMNNIMAKYFGEDFLSGLDKILGTEGGVMGNLDALNGWINQYHDLAVQADEEMQAATQAIQSMTGIGGGLEGLQAGLQGMTEETADILAAYLNSVRFYVADNNQLLQNLLNGLTIDNNSNPMLQQLKIVAAQTTSINLLLDSVVHSGGYKGNGGGSYLKVHAILES